MAVLNKFMRFSTETAETDGPITIERDTWNKFLDALGIDRATPTNDVLAFAEKIVEAAKEAVAEAENDKTTNASKLNAHVLIDTDIWEEIQEAAKIGVKAKNQEKRLAAEQVVDQAIRYGKLTPTKREEFIQMYEADPVGTTLQLSRRTEINRIEQGYGTNKDSARAEGWVRPS